jgi:hypothetical protein
MRWIFAGLLIVGLTTSGMAQQATSPYAPVATPAISPDMLETPQPVPETQPKKLKTNKETAPPALTAPKGINLGRSKLDIDVKNSDATNRGLVPDSGETSNLTMSAPGLKHDPTLPDYFGLKITAPTH